MEQVKIYWDLLKTKMDEDPVIKKAAICAVVAIAAIILMLGIKAVKSSTPEAPVVIEQVATVPAAIQPVVVNHPAPQQVPVSQGSSSQQVVSSAVKPLSSLSSMTPGYTMTYAYAGGRRIDEQSVFAKVADINRDTPTFQFLVKPDESLNQQIIPGDVVIQTKAIGYFTVEQQSAPLLNVLITSGGEERIVQVFIDDQVIPLIDNKDSGYGVSQVSLPIMQTYGVGLHRITVVSTTNYSKRDLKTSVRMSIKRDADPAPVDLQVYRDVPVQAITAAIQPANIPVPVVTEPVQASVQAPVANATVSANVKGGV